MLLTEREEEILKRIAKKAIEKTEREYIKILDESREDFNQTESDVKTLCIFI